MRLAPSTRIAELLSGEDSVDVVVDFPGGMVDGAAEVLGVGTGPGAWRLTGQDGDYLFGSPVANRHDFRQRGINEQLAGESESLRLVQHVL